VEGVVEEEGHCGPSDVRAHDSVMVRAVHCVQMREMPESEATGESPA
jgi:hypothetical protein